MLEVGKQFAVIGLGRFGQSLAKELHRNGYDVLAMDNDEEVVQQAASFLPHVVVADATEEETLKRLGIRNFDVVVIAIGMDVQASIMATLNVKEMGVGYVLAKALTETHAKVLEKIGANRVVFPEREMGVRVATNLMSGNIIDHIELSKNHHIIEVAVFDKWIGRSLKVLNMREKYGLNVLAIRRGEDIKISPNADELLLVGDILVVIASTETLGNINP